MTSDNKILNKSSVKKKSETKVQNIKMKSKAVILKELKRIEDFEPLSESGKVRKEQAILCYQWVLGID